jgi:hypothetical protein
MQLSLIQLVTTTIFNWAIWGYSIIQMVQAKSWIPKAEAERLTVNIHPTGTPEWILIIILLSFCLGWVFFTYKLYFVFGWSMYKEMGADADLKSKFIRMTMPFLNLC